MSLSGDPAEFAEIDDWIAACLRRDPAACRTVPPADVDRLVNRMTYHGVVGYLTGDRALIGQLPAELVQGLQEVARGQAFWELAHRRILTALAEDFAAEGIVPLVVKGTALAYSVYDRPTMRPRGDTDLLVPEAAIASARRILTDHGFRPWVSAGGEVRVSAEAWSHQDGNGLRHDIDLHWRINNSAVLAGLFRYEELMSRAAPLPRLAPGYVMPDPVDALLFASFHRYLHVIWPIRVAGEDHWAEHRLIWLLDIVELGRVLDAGQWQALVRRALEKGLGQVCHNTLETASATLGLAVPGAVLDGLARCPENEAPSRYLAAPALVKLGMDFRATEGFGRKLRFVQEHAFPPAAYMRASFGRGDARDWLAWLYLRRALGGAAKLLRRRRARL